MPYHRGMILPLALLLLGGDAHRLGVDVAQGSFLSSLWHAVNVPPAASPLRPMP